MYHSSPEHDEVVERIVHVVASARSKYRDGRDKADLIKRVSDAIHTEWELRGSPANSDAHPRSIHARQSLEGCVIDHPYPSSLLASDLLLLPDPDLRANYVEYLLWYYGGFAWITGQERDRLCRARLHDRMPDDWDGFDVYARYKCCDIHMGEEGVMSREELQDVLDHPYREYYVYLLFAPNGNVFYVGKGEGTRALSHEQEVFRRKFPIHTNWKKLNRIAQIVRSGRSVRYSIDSWHADGICALIREERLILKYENEAPRAICNSNGERSRGRPSKALEELRRQAGLLTPERR